MSENKEILEALRQKGYRITPQREQILDFFYNLQDGDHLSAEDLFDILVSKDKKISLATLYRTLNFLCENGLLRELDFGEDHKHYELISDSNHHHHLICNKCGLTVEFNDEDIVDITSISAITQSKFIVTDHQFKVFGLCVDCQQDI